MKKLALFIFLFLGLVFFPSCGDDSDSATNYTCTQAAQKVWDILGSDPFNTDCGDVEATCVEDMKQDCSGEDGTYVYGAWTQEQINCIAVGTDNPTICDCGTGTRTIDCGFCS